MNFIRTLRIVAGIFIVVQGVVVKDGLLIGAGILFSILPVLHVGCCSVSGCSLPVSKNSKIKKA